MQYVQQRYPHLMLEVYQKNQPAIDFYRAQGFHIVDRAWQDETQLPTWDYELAGGSNAVSVSSVLLYFSSHASAVLPAQPFPSRELGDLWSARSLRRFYKYRQRLNPYIRPCPFVNANHARFNSLANDRSGRICPREFHTRTISPSVMPRA